MPNIEMDRLLVVFRGTDWRRNARALHDGAYLRAIHGSEVRGDVAAELAPDEALLLPHLGVAVVAVDADIQKAIGDAAATKQTAFGTIERERVLEALVDVLPPPRWSDGELTWALRAVGVDGTTATGRGVRVAVLDTGLELTHPDFAGRPPAATRAFIGTTGANDADGHGTHCAGIVGGPLHHATGPRHAVAPDAELLVGKVLDDDRRGRDGHLLAGLDWALGLDADIVSLSLGARVAVGEAPSVAFQVAVRRALDSGTIIVAGVGNDSDRLAGVIAPIRHPANVPGVIAVSAIDAQGSLASFTNGAVSPNGNRVHLVAPGVDVRSSYRGRTHALLNGTSVAAPHVAGVASLWAELNPDARGSRLRNELLRHATSLEGAASGGHGLATAPRLTADDRAHIEVVVTAEDTGRTGLNLLAEKLSSAGLRVPEGGVYERLGLIIGTIEAHQAPSLLRVNGVRAVEAMRHHTTTEI